MERLEELPTFGCFVGWETPPLPSVSLEVLLLNANLPIMAQGAHDGFLILRLPVDVERTSLDAACCCLCCLVYSPILLPLSVFQR